MAKSDAFVRTSNLLVKSGNAKTSASVTTVLRISNAFWLCFVQTHGLFFFSNLVNGATLDEYPSMNRQ